MALLLAYILIIERSRTWYNIIRPTLNCITLHLLVYYQQVGANIEYCMLEALRHFLFMNLVILSLIL